MNVSDVTLWGGGNSFAGNTGSCPTGPLVEANPVAASQGLTSGNQAYHHFLLIGYGGACANTVGIVFQGGVTGIDYVQSDGFGGIPCKVNGPLQAPSNGLFCGDGVSISMDVAANGILSSFNGTYGPGGATNGCIVQVETGGTYYGFADEIGYGAGSSFVSGSAGVCLNGGTAYLNGDIINLQGNTNGICAYTYSASGSVLYTQNTTCKDTTATSSQWAICSTCKVYDEGGNNFNTTNAMSLTAGGLLIADGHQMVAACTGTATSSTTLGLYGSGPNATTTACTNATIGGGVVMAGPRTLSNLLVTAGTGGFNSSSGVFTILKNGSGTALTCTTGTGTSCSDERTQSPQWLAT